MMKLTDFIAEFLAKKTMTHCFGVTGGAVAHIFDSMYKHPQLHCVFNHHEQASAMAGTAYSRLSHHCAVVVVTTGPGGTNAITGLAAAWTDSIPVLFISGHTRLEHTSTNKPGVRSLGLQELDIISIVKPLTKYAVLLKKPDDIQYELEKAYFLAHSGRPGPVWIDIPLNFQWTTIHPKKLKSYFPSTKLIVGNKTDIEHCKKLLDHAKRPLILVGYGVRLSGAQKEILRLIEQLSIPFVTTWTASDIFETTHPLNIGRVGVMGQRGANLAIQNTDCLLVLGSHLNIPITSTNFNYFARHAKIIVVNIDLDQLNQSTIDCELKIHSDVKVFISKLHHYYKAPLKIKDWIEKCAHYQQYNFELHSSSTPKGCVDPIHFIHVLSKLLPEGTSIIVDGGGTNLYLSFQQFRLKKNQRLSVSSTLSSMGTGLPESIGAAFATPNFPVICMVGDGSLQFNIQELQTIVHYNLNIKIIVLNNDGYVAIRDTQKTYFDHCFVGSDKKTLSLPDCIKVANAYGVSTFKIDHHDYLDDRLKKIVDTPGPVLCEVMVDPNYSIEPTMGVTFRDDGTSVPKPLEDMKPYLDRNIFNDLMVVKPLEE